MSLIRILHELRPWAFRSPVSHRLDRVGFGFTPAELQAFFQFPDFKIRSAIASEEITPPKIDKNGFHVALNMKDFKPGEFVVKTVDNTVIVEGKLERKDDQQGLVSREFLRKFVLPRHYDPAKVESTLNAEGVLTIIAPAPLSNERVVEVKQIKDSSTESKPKEIKDT